MENYFIISSIQECIIYNAFQSLIGKAYRKGICFHMSVYLRAAYNVLLSASGILIFHFCITLLLVMKNGFCIATESKRRQSLSNEKPVSTLKLGLHSPKSYQVEYERCYPIYSNGT